MARFDYRPVARKTACRVVALREKLAIEKGQMRLLGEHRYSSRTTDDRRTPASEVVTLADDRCDQGDPIAPLKGGV